MGQGEEGVGTGDPSRADWETGSMVVPFAQMKNTGPGEKIMHSLLKVALVGERGSGQLEQRSKVRPRRHTSESAE